MAIDSSNIVLTGRLIDQDALRQLAEVHRRFVLQRRDGRRVIMQNCVLAGLDFTGLCFARAHFLGCHFTRADLTDADFQRARLFGSNFESADLTRANFERADRSEEHTSEPQSLMPLSYAVFCLKKKK